ncbi:DUF4232 domain-containing protein [Promicromonospora iranensis]|uniref:DUF4232 domain-containing protein n=1 Tax=Promicromonospora iranensis TaxID=1105144 RepID=A0ABU2CQR3_9MICO|nr:DUF4232 domain-containing protein [Promicromonospora iranensis]MDR7383675.1 hypothetical protein [Promicromonospora iranensis]
MPSLPRTLLIATAAALALAGCTPSAERPPDEIRSAADAVRELDGVLDVDVTRTTVGEPAPQNFGQREETTPSRVDARVELAESLDPAAAGNAVTDAQRLLAAASSRVDPLENITVSAEFFAGSEPSENSTTGQPWLSIRTELDAEPERVAEATEYGYELRATGAERVSLGVTSEAEGPHTAWASVVASSADDLVTLARKAVELDRGADLEAPGIRYGSASRPPDLAAVRLVVAAAGRPDVRNAAYVAGQPLTIQSEAAPGAQSLADLRSWLEARRFATADRPLAYTVLDAEYTESTGWVSGAVPAAHAPHTVPLPAGTKAWPDDVTAPACASGHLRIAWPGSDAATGHRYGLLTARNVARHACALEAVPEVVPLNDAGRGQDDVSIEPYAPGVVPGRVVVPPGEAASAAVEWGAMSTVNDPDLTTTLRVVPQPGTAAVEVPVSERPGSSPGGLDVLDGAVLRISPWVQALEGYSPAR